MPQATRNRRIAELRAFHQVQQRVVADGHDGPGTGRCQTTTSSSYIPSLRHAAALPIPIDSRQAFVRGTGTRRFIHVAGRPRSQSVAISPSRSEPVSRAEISCLLAFDVPSLLSMLLFSLSPLHSFPICLPPDSNRMNTTPCSDHATPPDTQIARPVKHLAA